jgi:hypothetical protein
MADFKKVFYFSSSIILLFFFVFANCNGKELDIKEESYIMYDRIFDGWKDEFKQECKNIISVKIILEFQKQNEGEFNNYVIYSSSDLNEIKQLTDIILDSKRLRWPVENKEEVRVTVEKMPAGELVFEDNKNNKHYINIKINSFQELSTSYYLEFTNPELKNLIDVKVSEWAEQHNDLKAYDVESNSIMNIKDWFKNNTRYH